jgi:hypothetical protein
MKNLIPNLVHQFGQLAFQNKNGNFNPKINAILGHQPPKQKE